MRTSAASPTTPSPSGASGGAQAASEHSAYIRWGDNVVEVLERGEEFSRCRHVRTGYELDILTKYLRTGPDGTVRCNDCTDYVLPLSPGDEVGVVETTSRGFLCKPQRRERLVFRRTGGRGMIVLYCLLGEYLLFINIDGFVMMAVDKSRARRGGRRVSEAALSSSPSSAAAPG